MGTLFASAGAARYRGQIVSTLVGKMGMHIAPLVQTAPLDIGAWEPDAEFGVFPQGARAKDAVFAPPTPPEPILVSGKRYLFKRSKRSYPDQFWGEIIAYRVGCMMGLEVPPAFAA